VREDLPVFSVDVADTAFWRSQCSCNFCYWWCRSVRDKKHVPRMHGHNWVPIYHDCRLLHSFRVGISTMHHSFLAFNNIAPAARPAA